MFVDPRTQGGPGFGGVLPTGPVMSTNGGGMEGLLGNPYLQMGLGILANNQGNYGALGPALGRGMSQGLQQVQHSKQMDMQHKLYQMKLKAYEQEQERAQKQEEAMARLMGGPEGYNVTKDVPVSAFENVPIPAAPDAVAPNFGLQQQETTTMQPQTSFDQNMYKQDIVNAGFGQNILEQQLFPEMANQSKFGMSPRIGINPETGNPEYVQFGDNGKPKWTGIRPTRDEIAIAEGIDKGVLPEGYAGGVPQGTAQGPMPTNGFNTPYPISWTGPTATDIREGTSPNMPPLRNPATPNLPPASRRKIAETQAEADIDKKKQLEIDEEKRVRDDKKALPGRNDALFSVQKAKGLLDQGIYTGAYANVQKNAAKYNPLADKSKAARTETFLSEIGNTVVPRLQEFGGNDSVEEMNYLKAIMGGNIELEEDAIRSILDSVEFKVQRGIDRHNKGLDADGKPKADRQQIIPSGAAGGNVPKTYDALPKKAPKGQIVRNPQTGERMQFDGMRWKPL